MLKWFDSDWKIVASLALPIFAVAMWGGISRQYKDLGLFAVAMALVSWSIGGWAVAVVRNWQQWRRRKNRQGRDD